MTSSSLSSFFNFLATLLIIKHTSLNLPPSRLPAIGTCRVEVARVPHRVGDAGAAAVVSLFFFHRFHPRRSIASLFIYINSPSCTSLLIVVVVAIVVVEAGTMVDCRLVKKVEKNDGWKMEGKIIFHQLNSRFVRSKNKLSYYSPTYLQQYRKSWFKLFLIHIFI